LAIGILSSLLQLFNSECTSNPHFWYGLTVIVTVAVAVIVGEYIIVIAVKHLGTSMWIAI
jgi:hypothetical protein